MRSFKGWNWQGRGRYFRPVSPSVFVVIEAGSVIVLLASLVESFAMVILELIPDPPPNLLFAANTSIAASRIVEITALVTASGGLILGILQLVFGAMAANREFRLKMLNVESEFSRIQSQLSDKQHEIEKLKEREIIQHGWVNALLNRKDGEPLSQFPAFNPDPHTATPQALANSHVLKTLAPLDAPPTVETIKAKVIEVVNAANPNSKSGINPVPVAPGQDPDPSQPAR
jgi:hypothetical protein